MTKGFVYYIVPGTLECSRDQPWIYRELLAAFSGDNYTKETIKLAMQNSINFGIYEFVGGNMLIVGFARVVSDKALFSTILDVVVTEAKRKEGFGRQLIEHILKDPSMKNTTWVIHTDKARGFYEKFGFRVFKEGIMLRNSSS